MKQSAKSFVLRQNITSDSGRRGQRGIPVQIHGEDRGLNNHNYLIQDDYDNNNNKKKKKKK